MPRFAEFFSGIGLVREAIEPLGWNCVFANDIAPDKAKMYIDRFGEEHLVVDDINNLSFNDLPDDLDLLTGHSPASTCPWPAIVGASPVSTQVPSGRSSI